MADKPIGATHVMSYPNSNDQKTYYRLQDSLWGVWNTRDQVWQRCMFNMPAPPAQPIPLENH